MSRPAFDLSGKVAIVTGGGSGIGRATALALASMGARVALTEQPGRGAMAKAVVTSIVAAGGEAIELALDVAATITIPSIVDAVHDHFGAVDILVNNAGAQILKPALDIDEAEFDQLLDVNLRGAFFCAQAVAPLMEAGGGGCIINIASQHGVVGNVDRAPYCASKGGLVNLTRALAVEWGALNIRVNAVSPTFVATDANTAAFALPSFVDMIARDIPLGRVAQVEDVAAAICFLASPSAHMITGHNLLVDGGWTAR